MGSFIICTAFVFDCYSVTVVHTLTQCHLNEERSQFPKAFQYLCQVVFAHYISSSYDGAYFREQQGKRQHRVVHEQVKWDSISVSVIRCMDSDRFPADLPWSQCLKFFNILNTATCRDLLHTNHTVLISQQMNCSMSSAHERIVYCSI